MSLLEKLLVAVLVVFAAVVLVGYIVESERCAASGGVLVRTAFGHSCIVAKELK